jgi:hypothetical protein
MGRVAAEACTGAAVVVTEEHTAAAERIVAAARQAEAGAVHIEAAARTEARERPAVAEEAPGAEAEVALVVVGPAVRVAADKTAADTKVAAGRGVEELAVGSKSAPVR